MRNVRDHYGASTANTPAQNTDAFLNALAAGPFEVPDETYICDAIVTSAARVNMRGWGYASRIVTPEFRVDVPTFNRGSWIKDMAFAPVSPDVGAGVKIVQTAEDGAFFEFELSGLRIGDYAGAGLTLDNSINSVDAFFTGIVHHCQISKQIKGIKIGDRMTFSENVVSGGALVGMDFSHVSGARSVLIQGNTIVTRGGGLALYDGEEVNILGNHIEHQAYKGAYVGPLQTMVSLSNTIYCRMLYNRVNAAHGYPGPGGVPNVGADYDLVIQNAGAHDNFADHNTWGPSKQASRAVIAGAGAGNVLGEWNRDN